MHYYPDWESTPASSKERKTMPQAKYDLDLVPVMIDVLGTAVRFVA